MDTDRARELGYVGLLQVRVRLGDPVEKGEPVCQMFADAPTTHDEAGKWAGLRLDRLIDHGPEPDGWGVWVEGERVLYQLLLRVVELPTP